MRRAISVLSTVGMCSAMFLFTAGTASAAPPSNNAATGATTISSVPFTTTENTTQATTDATDAALNANCGAPATEASVWFSYTPAADGTIVIDVSQSDYSAGVITATGTPGSLTLDQCGPGSIVQDVTGGQTLYILAFDDTVGSGNGGSLQLSVTDAPPPPAVSLTIDAVGHFNSKANTALVSGTATCTGGDFLDIQTTLRQKVGRIAITGSGFTEISCDGTSHWSTVVTGDNGRFGGGKVSVTATGDACNIVFCSEGDAARTVSLKK